MPHGMIVSAHDRSASQFSANPCIVTRRLTRTPMAPSLRSGPRSSARTQTPLRPSTRDVSTPTSRQTRIMTSSSRRTWATTSIGTSGSRTIG